MEVDKSVISDIEEWLGIENVELVKDKYIATASLPYDQGLISKIMSYGNNIKVISPKKLITEIINKANLLLKNYK